MEASDLARDLVGLGLRPGRVEAFLLSQLKDNALRSYTTALLGDELIFRGVSWGFMSEFGRDMYLAEYVLEGMEEGSSRQPLVVLVAALHKINRRERYKMATAVLLAWAHKLPPKQAPAAPREFVFGTTVALIIGGQLAVGTLLRLCLCAVLRIGEGLGLRGKDITFDGHSFVLVLGVTKRGRDQRVVISEVVMVTWMARYLKEMRIKPDQLVFPLSYQTVMRWLRTMGAHFKLADAGFTSHSFRRGGATDLLTRNYAIDFIVNFGRWASERSCKDYLRCGRFFQIPRYPENHCRQICRQFSGTGGIQNAPAHAGQIQSNARQTSQTQHAPAHAGRNKFPTGAALERDWSALELAPTCNI